MMTKKQEELWERIQSYNIDEIDVALPFSKRLMRENGWDLDYANRVIEEYKRFMLMLCVADHPVTPSDQVDQVWHLHLIYTRSYWDEFCDQILQQKAHHGPTKGGKQENQKYINLYELTQKLYRQLFHEEPPADIWYDTTRRFTEIYFERVNRHTHWIIPKPSKLFKRNFSYFVLLSVTSLTIWGCTEAHTPSSVMSFAIIVSLALLFFFVIVATSFDGNKKKKSKNKSKRRKRKGTTSNTDNTIWYDSWFGGWFDGGDSDGGNSCSGSGCSSGCSGCGGGCGGCGG